MLYTIRIKTASKVHVDSFRFCCMFVKNMCNKSGNKMACKYFMGERNMKITPGKLANPEKKKYVTRFWFSRIIFFSIGRVYL